MFKNIFSKDKEEKIKKSLKVARTVQEVLNFDGISENGIIVSGNMYSKLYKLVDSNFVTEPEEQQLNILENYSKLINRFDDNTTISLVIINNHNTTKEMVESYHLNATGDEYDKYREDYNEIIDAKIAEGHNEIEKEKYILLTLKEQSLTLAEASFATADIALNEATKAINKVGVYQLNAVERLSLIRKILRGAEGIPLRKEYNRYISEFVDGEDSTKEKLNVQLLKESGVSVKDLIAPQVIAKDKLCLQLDTNRWCKSFCFANLPQQLDTKFLSNVTNLPYEMVTVIQLKPVPRKKAITLVKMQNTSIKADVIKASKEAYSSGYDPNLMNEDLVQAREEAGFLRNEIVNGGKKLFFATMVCTIFGKDRNDVEQISNQYISKCSEYTVSPSYLIGQQIEGLNTSILVSNSKIIVDRMLTSNDVQALFPFNIQELNDKKGCYYGSNAISKNLVMYDRKHSKLANGLILGQAGSGKSFFIKGEIIRNILEGNNDIIILDPENEYGVVAEQFGGRIIDLELNSENHINPCDLTFEWDNPKVSPIAEKCDYMVGLVESILGRGKECNTYETNVIHRVTTKMYDDYVTEMTRRHKEGIEGQNDRLDVSICPTLVDFYNGLLADASPEAIKIANACEQYCVGNYNIFAHHTNTKHSRITVYNLLHLPEKMTEMAMKVCLTDIWSKTVKNRENNIKFHTGNFIWVYLDEFHHFFKTESSVTTILNYYKRVRKYGGIITGITQDVADILSSRQGTGMFNNTGFFVFFNQSTIGRNQIQQLYTVSDTLIDYIKDKPYGTGLMYNGSVLIPIDYSFPQTSALYKIMSTKPNEFI